MINDDVFELYAPAGVGMYAALEQLRHLPLCPGLFGYCSISHH